MTSSAPREPEARRIIPLRPLTDTDTQPIAPTETGHAQVRDREDAARHYLKFMLPSIPVATFILTFVLCYVLLGLPDSALGAAQVYGGEVLDPTLPFLGALLLGLITSLLCMWIYFGYLRVSGADARRT